MDTQCNKAKSIWLTCLSYRVTEVDTSEPKSQPSRILRFYVECQDRIALLWHFELVCNDAADAFAWRRIAQKGTL